MRGQIRIQMKMRMAMGRRVSWFNITEEDQNQNQCEDEVFTLRCCRGKRKYRELEVTKISVAKAGMPSDEDSMLMMLLMKLMLMMMITCVAAQVPPTLVANTFVISATSRCSGGSFGWFLHHNIFIIFLMLIDYDTRIGIR